MKNIPNIITSVRLVCSLILLILCGLNTADPYFLGLFIAAGVSDMLDGFIARRFNWCTEFGANLDSISDLSLYMSTCVFLWTYFAHSLTAIAPLIAIGACAQLGHLIYAFKRHGSFPAYHSDLSRLSAYLIGFGVIAFYTLHLTAALPVITVLWTLCSLEGAIMTAVLPKATTDVPSIREALELRSRHNAYVLQGSTQAIETKAIRPH